MNSAPQARFASRWRMIGPEPKRRADVSLCERRSARVPRTATFLPDRLVPPHRLSTRSLAVIRHRHKCVMHSLLIVHVCPAGTDAAQAMNINSRCRINHRVNRRQAIRAIDVPAKLVPSLARTSQWIGVSCRYGTSIHDYTYQVNRSVARIRMKPKRRCSSARRADSTQPRATP